MTTARIFRHLPPAGGGFILAAVLATALGASGCAGADASLRPTTVDVLGSAAVTDTAPRVLIEGPTRILHLEVEPKGTVALFRAPRRPGSGIDCRRDGIAVDVAETRDLEIRADPP
jgi:hypothetical protein